MAASVEMVDECILTLFKSNDDTIINQALSSLEHKVLSPDWNDDESLNYTNSISTLIATLTRNKQNSQIVAPCLRIIRRILWHECNQILFVEKDGMKVLLSIIMNTDDLQVLEAAFYCSANATLNDTNQYLAIEYNPIRHTIQALDRLIESEKVTIAAINFLWNLSMNATLNQQITQETDKILQLTILKYPNDEQVQIAGVNLLADIISCDKSIQNKTASAITATMQRIKSQELQVCCIRFMWNLSQEQGGHSKMIVGQPQIIQLIVDRMDQYRSNVELQQCALSALACATTLTVNCEVLRECKNSIGVIKSVAMIHIKHSEISELCELLIRRINQVVTRYYTSLI